MADEAPPYYNPDELDDITQEEIVPPGSQRSDDSNEGQRKRKGGCFLCCYSPVCTCNFSEAFTCSGKQIHYKHKLLQILFSFCPECRKSNSRRGYLGPCGYVQLVAYCVAYGSALLALILWGTQHSPRRPLINVLMFIFSFLGMMPSAKEIGSLTDQMSLYVGPGLAALITATFGNIVELMVAFVALGQQKAQGITLVQASLIGSILSNLLLVLGTALLAAGWHRHIVNLSDNHDRIQNLEQEMVHLSRGRETREEKAELKNLVEKSLAREGLGSQTGAGTLALCIGGILIPTILARGTNASDQDILHVSRITSFILLFSYVAYLYFTSFTHAKHLESKGEEDDDEQPKIQGRVAVGVLIIHAAILGVLSFPLTDGLNGMTHGGTVKEVFFALVILPIIGNLAEHATAVMSGWRSKMVQALGIAIGSGIQICLFVIPACVLFAWAIKVPLSLNFDPFQVVAIFVAIFIVNALITDDESNWLEGFILVLVYIIIAVGAYYDPYNASTLSTSSQPNRTTGRLDGTGISIGSMTAGNLLANLSRGAVTT